MINQGKEKKKVAVRDAAAYASQTRMREKSTFGAEKSPKRVLSFAVLGPISCLSLAFGA